MNCYKVFICLTIVLVFVSCAVKKVKHTQSPKPSPIKEEAPVVIPIPHETPLPVQQLSATLVLGGGGVASFATVGVLKKFEEEKIRINSLIVTGWPAIFAVIYGFTGSSYDTEWFAMKLKKEDFLSGGFLSSFNFDFPTPKRIGELVSELVKKSDLRQSDIAVILTYTHTSNGNFEYISRGHWLDPLLKSVSLPGVYGPYPPKSYFAGISSLNGLDVGYALSRGSERVVSIDMYGDFIESELRDRLKSNKELFKKAFFLSLRKSISSEAAKSHFHSRITLNKSPFDFSAKRIAIVAGYGEADNIIKKLKKSSINN